MTGQLYTVNGGADLLEKDRRLIARVLKNVPPDSKARGKSTWRLPTIVNALIADAESRTPDAAPGLTEARTRVANARAESAEFELEAQVGKWIEVEEATKGVIAEIILIRENALTCAGKVSDSLHQVDREQAYDIVDTEIRECLGRLGSGKGGIEFAIEVIERGGGKQTWVLELLNQLLEYYEEAERRDKVAKEKRDNKGDNTNV